MAAALNQSLAVWEMSPIGTAIDRDLMSSFKKLFGYPRTAEGSLVPGGAFANLTALLAARDRDLIRSGINTVFDKLRDRFQGIAL